VDILIRKRIAYYERLLFIIITSIPTPPCHLSLKDGSRILKQSIFGFNVNLQNYLNFWTKASYIQYEKREVFDDGLK
jgi:hypothetical protein